MKVNITSSFAEAVKPPAAGQVDYWDRKTSGFGLRVSMGGSKTWIVRYRQGGSRRRYLLGRFPQLNVADARQAARRYLGEVATGKDPAAERARGKAEPTFADLATLYLERHAALHNKPRTLAEVTRMLRADILPAWGHRKVSSIGRKDVIALLDDIVARGAPISANRVKALVSTMFGFALDRELVDAHPAYRIRRPAPEHSRDRVLSDDEIRQFWQALENEPLRVGGGFKLALLTAARSSEVFGMTWSELDLDGGWWTLPAERSKNGKAHHIPLVAPALTLLRALQDESKGCELVIRPGKLGRGGWRPLMCPRNWLAAIRRSAGLAHFTTHDLRRTVASKMTELGVPRLTVSKLLNHAETGVTAVYDRHSYAAEKRAALLKWERRLREIVEESTRAPKVVAIGGKAN
jgi:integrase